jgi:FkbM family methyltransferase
MLRNQDGIIKHGAAKGLLFNTGSSNVGFCLGSADPEIQNAFKMLVRPSTVVYDVGANVGFLTVIAARFTGAAGRVIAFEPLAENFKMLQRNVQLNGFAHVVAKNVALADRDGTAAFRISSDSTFGALVDTAVKVHNEIGRTEVALCRMDSIVQQDSLPLPNLIKMDVEGAEAMVLDGALNTIQKARPILLIELHGTNAVIAEKLNALGYVSTVIGGAGSIVESHWNSHVVAFPAPCPELDRIQMEHWRRNE